MLMTAADYRESLRGYSPRVFVDGERVESVADAPLLQPGINALGVTYDFAARAEHAPLMTARRRRRAARPSTGCCTSTSQPRRPAQQARGGAAALPGNGLRAALPRPRRAQRARPGDARASTTRTAHRATARASPPTCTHVQDQDLTLGIAMTDAKGDRSQAAARSRPTPTATCTSSSATPSGIVISRHQGDRHRRALRARVPGHALPQHDARPTPTSRSAARCRSTPPGVTIVARPAGRPGREHGGAVLATSTASRPASCIFDDVFVAVGARLPRRRVGALGAPHLQLRDPPPPHLHRRARRLRRPADRRRRADVRGERLRSRRATPHLREPMVELIKIIEGFYRLRRRGHRLRRARRASRHRHARPGVRQHRQAAARRRRSTTCTGSPTTSRAA